MRPNEKTTLLFGLSLVSLGERKSQRKTDPKSKVTHCEIEIYNI